MRASCSFQARPRRGSLPGTRKFEEKDKRPLPAFGNSDGDLQMLQVTAAGQRRRLACRLVVHHDDAQREFAYDRQSSVGRLDKALDEAKADKWIVVSMKADWNRIIAFDN